MDLNATPNKLFEDSDERRIEELRTAADGVRLSIIVDGRRVATVGVDGAANLRLHEGAPWTDALAAAVAAENDYDHALQDAVGWLAAKGRSCEEVRRRLVAKGHDPAAAQRAVAHLVEIAVLNDQRLAEESARFMMDEQGLSSGAIRDRLVERGFEARHIAAVVKPSLDRERALEAAREWSRAASPGRERVEARRALSGLARRGFDEETAMAAVHAAFAERGVSLDDLAVDA